MRILVTGASGLLGLNLSLGMTGTHTIVGVDRNKLAGTPFEIVKADLLEAGVCSRSMDDVRPDAIIHTAAIANVDACESDPEGARTPQCRIPRSTGGTLCEAWRSADPHLHRRSL